MKNRIAAELGIVMVGIFCFSFPLTYLWESIQAVYLYQKHDFAAGKYVRMTLYVAFIDTLLIEGVYLFKE